MITLRRIRQWALASGVARADLRDHCRDALLLCISNLVQALHREALCTTRAADGEIRLEGTTADGPAQLIAPAHTDLPFKRLRVTGWPRLRTAHDERVLRTGGAFLRALADIVPGCDQDEGRKHLRADFDNSFANLVLNRLLAQRRGLGPTALEPVYQGHQTYPFPGLRVGPSVEDIVACSHLNDAPISLRAVELGELVQISQSGADSARLTAELLRSALPAHAASALSGAAVLLVHPWQLSLSPGLNTLLAMGKARLLDVDIPAVPLASQRTCRLLASGYDIKLPVDAVLTGEYRLLYRLNCENAVAVSSALRTIVEREGMSSYFGGQFDIASFFHPLPALSPTLSAIVREPIPGYGVDCIPAINLWSGPRLARRMLGDGSQMEAFFRRYCKVLLQGPLELMLHHGLATEPHIQNSLIAFDAHGMPSRLVIRDIDATVIDTERWANPKSNPKTHQHAGADGAVFAADTWSHMPAFSEGCKRTMYALHFGHLGVVIDTIATECALPQQRLVGWLDEVWKELTSAASVDARARDRAASLAGYRDAVRVCLANRLVRNPGLRFMA